MVWFSRIRFTNSARRELASYSAVEPLPIRIKVLRPTFELFVIHDCSLHADPLEKTAGKHPAVDWTDCSSQAFSGGRPWPGVQTRFSFLVEAGEE